MSEIYDGIRKVYFTPSEIENIDRSVFNYVESLDLHVDTNQGFSKVPVLWGTSERSFLSKDKKEARDDQGTLKFPLISIRRTSFSKPLKSGGAFQGNVPEVNDEQGGSLPIGKIMYQERTMAFANAEAQRLHGQDNYPRPNHKVVYKTVYAPMPVNVEVMYEITLRTEYQQQINDLMLPFVTKPGTINYVFLESEGHRYEGFIQDQHQSSDNLSDFSAAERKFETKITLKVIGYLVGQGKNREKAHFSVRQSVVEVKMPRERVVLSEIPEHEYGAYYGLPGVGPSGADSVNRAGDPQGHTNPIDTDPVRAPVGGAVLPPLGAAAAAAAARAGRGGFAGMFVSNDHSGNAIYRGASGMLEKYVRNLMLKKGFGPPVHNRLLTVPGFVVRANSETILKSTDDGRTYSKMTRGEDYTMSGNLITFTSDIENADEILITYIKG